VSSRLFEYSRQRTVKWWRFEATKGEPNRAMPNVVPQSVHVAPVGLPLYELIVPPNISNE
jgi:hypothetical protein